MGRIRLLVKVKRTIYTANIGDLPYASMTLPLLKSYAGRVGADFRIITSTERPHPFHSFLDFIGLAKDGEPGGRHLWVDLDIVVRPDAANAFDLCEKSCWAALHPNGMPKAWRPFAQSHGVGDLTPYYSTGMVLLSTEIAEKLWEAGAKKTDWEVKGDQEVFGLLWRLAGIPMRFIPAWIHSLWLQQPREESGFVHFGGSGKCDAIAEFLDGDRSTPNRGAFQRWYSKPARRKLESMSGLGSSLAQTENLRRNLPELFRDLGVKTMLDAPCGDWNWMSTVDLSGIDYVGGDIVPEVVEQNRRSYGEEAEFRCIDICHDDLGRHDLIFCRDALVHLPNALVSRFLRNAAASGSRFLAMTNFPDKKRNFDTDIPRWRAINMMAHPFSLPEPILRINEGCPQEGRADKEMAVWRLDQL